MPKKLLVNIEKNVQNDDIITETIPENDIIENKTEAVVEKKPRGRPTGSIKNFKKEQEYVILKMNSILGITKDSETIIVSDLNDVNGTKYNEILALVPDVKKYFKCGLWRYFATHSDKPSLLVKNLYNAYGYEAKQSRETVSNVVIHTLKIKKI